MKQYNKILALAMGVCLFEAAPSFAAVESETASQARLENAIQKINTQTESLQKEVKELRAELQVVKKEKQALQRRVPAATSEPSAEKSTQASNRTTAPRSLLDIPQLQAVSVVTGRLPAGDDDLDPSAFLSGIGSMSQGMFFLEQQQALEKQLNGAPLPYADRPQVMLGGKLEASGTWQSPYSGSDNSSLDLVTAELEVLGQVSEWASGYMTIDYNNSALDPVLNGSGNPTNNSNIYLGRGFLTIGNLNKSPIYFSAGQMYAPFGQYASNILSNPVTKVLGRTNSRVAQLGFDKDGFDVSVYAFNGGSDTGNANLNKWGANTTYRFTVGQYSANLGAGFINNMADAGGAQLTGGGMGTFGGFAQSPATETLVHYVPGVDLHAFVARGPLYVVAEGIGATRAYDMHDMTFNAGGAQPKAGHVEAGYNFKMFGKKSIFNVAYEQTWDALAMGLPKNSYIATLSSSLFKNTIEVLEFRHDVNYADTDTSAGACGLPDASGNTPSCAGPSGGGTQNTILAQVGVYF